ncbi:MAG: nitronate monooxygenase [Candidatus Margulisbacteria bacterium]|nr:nitronate monooxygenase [Candidatus Margulisiibacteriota bacterium]
MKYNLLKIKNLKPVIPIIQGGMAVRVSTGRLAGAVAACNAIGTIGGSGMSNEELKEEIAIARKISGGNGLIAVNIMVAASEFLDLVKVCIDSKVDLIFAGAGFSMDVFRMCKEADIAFAPVVSSVKAAKLGLKMGADMIIVEGKEAGGHLGTDRPMKEILKEILDEVKGKVPVIGAGGVLYGKDICEVLKMGASGVQMATRFVMSDECNVDIKFKQYYLDHTKKDMKVFLSPVGYPGRAIMTKFLEKVEAGKIGQFPCKYICLKSCNRRFCIIEALKKAKNGEVDEGIVFTGERFDEIHDILPVKTIIDNLVKEMDEC